MTVNLSASIIATLIVHLTLDIEVGNTNNASGSKKGSNRVHDGVELGYHGKRIRHGNNVGEAGVCSAVEAFEARRAWGRDLEVEVLKDVLVVIKAEMTCVLADDSNVLPAKAVESLLGDLAEGRGKVDKEDGAEEAGNVDEACHLFNVVASTAANLSSKSI